MTHSLQWITSQQLYVQLTSWITLRAMQVHTLSEINLRDQKVDTLSEPDHLDYFSRNLQSHTLKSSLTVYAVLVEKKLQV